MSLILAQTNGRLAARQVLRGQVPNLARFNVEPSRLYSYGLCASMRNQNEMALSRMGALYNTSLIHALGGMTPVLPKLTFSLSFAYINQVAKRNPWTFGFCTACTKAVLADIVAQTLIEKKTELDLRRTGMFFAFGAVYSGIICNVCYSWLYPLLFRSRYHKLNALASALTDNLINMPFIMMPTLYAMKECFLFPGGSLTSAFRKYKSEIWEASTTGWKIWFPAHLVTFGLIPTYLRLPYVSCVSFFFFTVISIQQSYFDQRRQELQNNIS